MKPCVWVEGELSYAGGWTTCKVCGNARTTFDCFIVPKPGGAFYTCHAPGEYVDKVEKPSEPTELPPDKDATHNPVTNPTHYTGLTPEPLEVFLKWGLGFAETNAMKYIVRAGRKDPKKWKEDMEKAIYYLQRLVAHREAGGK